MGLFIGSRSLATAHGVYAEERPPPASIEAAGTGVVGLVGVFPWGPVDQVIIPTDTADRAKILAPAGMARTGSAWLSTIRKAWPDLRFVRVAGSAAAVATADLLSGATHICTVPAKWKGAAGNSINCIVTNPDDGDVNHFNLEVQVTGASGTTSDFYSNLNYSATGTNSPAVALTVSGGPVLAGPIAKLVSGRPDNGTYAMTGGTDGTIDATRYTGTADSGDFGFALFENDDQINTVFTDDPGNTIRAAVNAAALAHCVLKGDRIAVLNGNSGITTPATVVTAANVNSSTLACWADPWCYINDDTDGTERLVPPNAFLASVIAQTSPSSNASMKDQAHVDMLAGITRLETPRGMAKAILTKGGVCTIAKEKNGGFAFEAAVLTCAPANPPKKRITRMRMGIYIAASITDSLRPSVDQPNVPLNQQDVIHAVIAFMEGLVANASSNPNGLPHVLGYNLGNLNAVNAQSDLDNGDYTIPLNVKTSAGMERIFLSMQFGETVQITAS